MTEEKWIVYPLRLEILTPVIINSGKTFDYGEIVIDDEDNAKQINLIKAARFFSPCLLNQMVQEVSKRGSSYSESRVFPFLKRLMSEHPEIVETNLDFLSFARTRFQESPGMEISKITVDRLTGRPYIPGSSLKGAIRTALLEAMRIEKKIGNPDYSTRGRNLSRNFEAGLFSDEFRFKVQDDPFRDIKVSDFILEKDSGRLFIGEASYSPTTIYSEMTDASVLHESKTVVAHGTISISSRIRETGIHYFDDMKMLLAKTSRFYIDAFKGGTKTKCDKNGVTDHWTQVGLLLEAVTNNGGYPLRVGHYSGIENMTLNVEQNLEFNRRIHNPKINTEGANTLHMIERKYLAGFCALFLEDEK